MNDLQNQDKSPLRIAYQGIRGSFSYQASSEIFPGASLRGYRSFREATDAVTACEADYAVIPVENSTAGRVMEVYNLLPESDLHIVSEHLLAIHHCLMIPHKAFRGTPPHDMTPEELLAWKASALTDEEKGEAFASIHEVVSHPQALAQSRKYLHAVLPKAQLTDSFDTASAARDIAAREDAEVAAIASCSAAEIYNMQILAEDIEDIHDNTTRFIVLGCHALDADKIEGPCLTTMLFEASHTPGSLFRALSVFEKHNINMTKLETYMSGYARPNPMVYVDIGTNLASSRMKHVLEEFRAQTLTLRLVGSYPASPKRGQKNSFLPVD